METPKKEEILYAPKIQFKKKNTTKVYSLSQNLEYFLVDESKFPEEESLTIEKDWMIRHLRSCQLKKNTVNKISPIKKLGPDTIILNNKKTSCLQTAPRIGKVISKLIILNRLRERREKHVQA